MNRAEATIANLLDEFRDGRVDRARLLANNPQLGAELGEYIDVVDALMAARPADPAGDVVTRRRRVFESQVDRLARQGIQSNWRRQLLNLGERLFAQTRLAAATLALVVAVLAGSAVSVAALAAPPGSPLYNYKLTVEQATIQLTAKQDRPAAYIQLAERRVAELSQLGPDASSELVAQVSDSYRQLVKDGLASINSLESTSGFDYTDAYQSYQDRLLSHSELLATSSRPTTTADPEPGSEDATASSPDGSAATPAPDPTPSPTAQPTPTPAATPTSTPEPTATVEPEPTAAPELVTISGVIDEIGRGALRIGETTVLLDPGDDQPVSIQGEPAIGARAEVTGVQRDENTIAARQVRIITDVASAPTATPTTVRSTPTVTTTPEPTPSPVATATPLAPLAPFDYSGYIEAYGEDTLTIDGRVIFIAGDTEADAVIVGGNLGVGALVDVSGELMSDLRLRARRVVVRSGAV